MKKNLIISIFSLLFLTESSAILSDEIKFGLGSCIHQDEPQPIWNAIKKDNLDGFIFLGDNVYGDSPSLKLNKMAKAYNKQKDNFPTWLMEKEILAIWDDHDYGKNDGGSEYKLKKEAQELFLEFWDIPTNDMRQSREGIYFALIKNLDGIKIHIIGLDTRYFRSELKDLIEGLNKQVVVISGDRHRGGIYQYNNIFEITSSSMNKPVKGFETDALLIGETHYEENYGVISINTDSSQIQLDLKDKKGSMLESLAIPLPRIQ